MKAVKKVRLADEVQARFFSKDKPVAIEDKNELTANFEREKTFSERCLYIGALKPAETDIHFTGVHERVFENPDKLHLPPDIKTLIVPLDGETFKPRHLSKNKAPCKYIH